MTHVGAKCHLLDTVEIPHGKAIMGLSGQLSSSVRSKRDHSIFNNGTTCDAAFR